MPATPPRGEKPRDASRRMIKDRAARLLVEKGYGATSLRDIAQACQMKAGSLYYHFDSKDALVEEILVEGVNRVEELVREALLAAEQAAPLDRIRIAMEVHLGALHERSDYASAHIRCSAHVPAPIRRRLGSTRASYEAIWTDLLDSARKADQIAADVDLGTLKFAVLGMMNWTLEWRPPAGTGRQELADHFFRIAFKGAANA